MKKIIITSVVLGFIVFNYNCLAQNVVNVYLPEPCSTIDIQEPSISNHIDFKISPNPNEGRFSISLENIGVENLKINIQVLDIMGRIVYNEDQSLRKGKYEFSDLKFTSGIYYIRLQNDKKSSVKMFIVQ
jgi:hypothetical protein